MKYYHNLYLSDGLKEKKEGIIYKLEHDKIQLNKYVIVLAENANNNLEFYDAALLLQLSLIHIFLTKAENENGKKNYYNRKSGRRCKDRKSSSPTAII